MVTMFKDELEFIFMFVGGPICTIFIAYIIIRDTYLNNSC